MQQQSGQLLRIQEQMSSGKKINRPSDDPIGQAAIIRNNQTLSEVDQFLRNITQADTSLSFGESALQSVGDQLLRARELATQAANATYTAADRVNIAKEVKELYDQMVGVANASQGGRYVFAGDQTGAAPFVRQGNTTGTAITATPVSPVTINATNNQLTLTLDGTTSTITLPSGAHTSGAALATMLQTAINSDPTFSALNLSATVTFETDHLVVQSNAIGVASNANVTGGTAQAVLGLSAGVNRPAGTYVGDSGESRIAIDKHNTVIKNIPGDRLIIGAGGGTNILAALGGLQSALESNNMGEIQNALTNIKQAGEQISKGRATIGSRLNRIATTADMLEDFKIVVTRLKADQEDVDLSKAISELVLQQNALEASRSLASRVFTSPTLMDFLR